MTNTLVNATNLTKNAESDYSTQSNMPVQESQLMSIDMANAAFIMESLTNLYSDPYLSVVREYVANAIDSHIEAGNPNPIEVTAPGNWNSNLVIKDQGIGMSQDDVFRYGTYGSSDKRDNLKVVGNFGMGSKSALAISNSFTITAVKDGEYTLASIGRNDEGFGQVDIIENEPTTEPNGVTITIPITSGYTYTVQDKIREVISKLPAGLVSVDGVVNTDFRERLTKISDDVFVSDMDIDNPSFYYNQVTIISGGFGYRVSDELVNEIARNIDFAPFAIPSKMFIDVPTGSVDLTPSREQLRMTARTKTLVTQVINDTLRECDRIYQDKFDNVSTFEGAFSLASELGAPDGVLDRFKNLVIPAGDKPVATVVRTGSGDLSHRRDSNINKSLANTILRSPEGRAIILERDRKYSDDSVTNRVKKYLTKVTDDTYSRHTPVIEMSTSYVDDPKDGKDNLYRFLDRTAVRMKVSEIYSAVNEYNKENRAYTGGGGSVATGRADMAIIYTDTVNGANLDTSFMAPTSGTMKKVFDEYFNNGLPVTYVLNNTKSSGKDIDTRDVQLVLSVLAMGGTSGAPTNVVLIKGGNRKPEYFISRGINVLTVKQFYDNNKEDLLSDEAVCAYRTVANQSQFQEMGYAEERAVREFRNLHPGCGGTLDTIVEELSAKLNKEEALIAEAVVASYRMESAILSLGRRLGEFEKAETIVNSLYDGDRKESRGGMMVSALQTIRYMFRHGHEQAGCDMLETLAELLTKEED